MRWRILVSGLLLLALAGQADTLPGRGSGVHDGDTHTVMVNGRESVKVRLGRERRARTRSAVRAVRPAGPGGIAVREGCGAAETRNFLTGRGGAKRACGEMASCVEAWSYLGRLRNAPPHRRAAGVGNPDPEPVCCSLIGGEKAGRFPATAGFCYA